MKASRNLITIFILFLLLSVLYVSHVDAQPYWLRRGVYAVYRFEDAYAVKGFGESGWELVSLGGGYYKWQVVDVNESVAVLEVTLRAGNMSRSVNVTLDLETMSLIDEDGRVWGKAWLWIDLTKMPPAPPNNTIIRNVTVVMNWLNESLRNPLVSRVYSLTKEGGLKAPFRMGLGSVDRVVSFSSIKTGLRRYKRDNTTVSVMTVGPENKPAGLMLQWLYEAKYGLMIGGWYMDDILSQKFGIVLFSELSHRGGYGHWIYLYDTNLDIGVSAGGFDILAFLKQYYIYILIVALASLFIAVLLRGRI